MANMGFRKKLLLTILPLVAITVGVLAFVSYRIASNVVLEQQMVTLTQVVDKSAIELDEWLNYREEEVAILSETGVFQAACVGKRLEEAEKRLQKYHAIAPVHENIFLADTAGKIFMDSIGGKSVGIEVAKIPGFKINVDKAQLGEIWIGTVLKSPATGRPVCLITAPVKFEGRFVGIIGTPLDLLTFSKDFLEKTSLGASGYLFMVDSTGLVAAHPNKDLILKTNILSFDFGKPIMERKNGAIDYLWNGEEKTAVFRTSDKTGWIITGTVTTSELLAPIRKIGYISGVLGLGAVILISLVTWWITGTLFKIVNRAVVKLDTTSEEVKQAAEQVSSSGHSLAEGASEQAASVEETSASIEELTSMTRRNAENAAQAGALSGETLKTTVNCSDLMQEMAASIGQVNEASEETRKIVKTIDEIAFQTNLLALNAAVEAARAGEAGAGFAVVAGEVRNLAMRAADAARDTTDQIGDISDKINEAMGKVFGAIDEFGKVSENTEKVDGLVKEIAAASAEQAQGIDQIGRAVTELDKITQQNASNAEESAAAGEELNAQAVQIRQFVETLNRAVTGTSRGADASTHMESTGASFHKYKGTVAPKVRSAKSKPSEVPPEKLIPLDDEDLQDF